MYIIVAFRDAGGYRIVGCPKSIVDNKYARNALIFNVVFVFGAETDTSPYEPVVQKLGEAFKTYEVTTEWIVHYISYRRNFLISLSHFHFFL